MNDHNCQHKLYKELSWAYDIIYEDNFDYDNAAEFVDMHLKERGFKKVLEVGCGAGSLTRRLINLGYEVVGLDASEEMIEIAKGKVQARFVCCDMRNINIDERFDAVICLGRTFTYMKRNSDAMMALNNFRSVLKDGGLLIMDNFSAAFILENFRNSSQDFTMKDDVKIVRINNVSLELSENVSMKWKCTYITEKEGKVGIVSDETTLRAFFLDELRTLAEMKGFVNSRFYNDYDFKEFDGGKKNIIIVATKDLTTDLNSNKQN
jgi:ubiquinone/menaquinone biosynthesis C-methylase UbiE